MSDDRSDIIFTCQNCNAKLKAPYQSSGKNGKCPNCGQRLTVPEPSKTEQRNG